MLLSDALLEFGFSKDRSAASQQWYRSRLSSFFDWLTTQEVDSVEAVTAPLVRRYIDARRTALSRTGKPLNSHTLHGHVRAIRAFLHWAARDDLIDEKLPQRIALPVKEQYVITPFTPQQVERLLTATKAARKPLRDAAILCVLFDSGIRASELCSLTLDRTFLTPEDSYLVVDGKGRRQREVPLGARSRLALHRYLTRERKGDAPYTFLSRTGGALDKYSLDRLFRRTRDRAGAEHFRGVRVSPHTCRHTYATRFLESGGDIYKLSRILGHSAVSTTELYLKAVSARDARRSGLSVLDTLGARGSGRGLDGRSPSDSDAHRASKKAGR